MESDDLFRKYVDVCNQAIAANKNRFPFKQILNASQKNTGRPKNVEVCIIDDLPMAEFVIHMERNKVSGKSHESCPDCQCDGKWRVTRSYLKDVIENPQVYIDNPAKINWDWMYGDNQAQDSF